ncbi:MAG: hypothetical protein HY553_11285 [Elusimicrobia bacterium]|nr:hypothetical protein [Elusimicrobiota bacterium]
MILDLFMPHAGIEVIRELRAKEETRDIPIVVFTARIFKQDMFDFLSAEGNVLAWVDKGMGIQRLRAELSRILAGDPAAPSPMTSAPAAMKLEFGTAFDTLPL